MVIKGNSVAGGKALAVHVLRKDTNERRCEVVDMRGVAAENVHEAIAEMRAVASGGCPNCKKPLYHASINTREHERLTGDQWMHAVDRLEKELGLTEQPRFVVMHEKDDGREHCHVVWSRIDLDKMRVISDSHNYRKHELVARGLEREFGHERVQGAHIEREGKPRPERTPSHKEQQQGARTGISPKAAKELMTQLWQETETGRSFQERLEQEGWLLCRGDRRDFVGVDPRGGAHSLARRIEGAKAADVRKRMADVNPFSLYSVAEAKEVQQERAAERERQAEARREQIAEARMRAATKRPKDADGHEAGQGSAAAADRVAEGVAHGVGKALDGIASAFEGLFGGGSSSSEETREDARPPDRGAPPSEEERAKAAKREAEAENERHAKYLRAFDRAIPQGLEKDAEIERDRQERERGGRERER